MKAWRVDMNDQVAIDLKAQEKFAEDLLSLIETTFLRAYNSRVAGMTIDEMLIYHDIEAAASNVDKSVIDTCRRTIQTAVKAVDCQVAYDDAHAYLVDQLQSRLSKLLKSNERKQRRRNNALD